ncbi:long-chain fatty acid--CoA ligase [Pseudorhodoplanes sp.]|uniref:AMP-dependent synthetase/ligase n=1 Tax=Pseudorhodoplanes sp. TaxID=1934341 RepID=UPI002D1BDDBD|nr:long-chain fatty acid--CoA ligase [Pseudorhodoplanes sp.]HWV41868.1 long-chain fatty acid--CoA ligase [Pseudorhodoplanes sp.]
MTQAAPQSPQFAILRGKTAPGLIAEHARQKPDDVAYRAKTLGLYRERTWRDHAAAVGRCARALQALGLQKGDRIAIMGDACEEWVVCDMAAQATGAIVYGIYPTASVSEVEFLMKDGGAKIFVAEDQEYVDKILQIADRLPDLNWIVVIDDSAMFDYSHPKLIALSQIEAKVTGDDEAQIAALEAMTAALKPEDPAFIVYTSGTTGNPKGALISHGKHLAGTYTIVDHYPTLRDKDHRTVVFLPLCHIFGRDVAITLPLISRLVPHYGESVDDLMGTMFEVAPTVLFTVPRYMQKFASQVLVSLSTTSPAKRAIYNAAMSLGRAAARRRWAGASGPSTDAMTAIARTVAFGRVLNKLGLDKLELAISGAAPLPRETAALWQIWGVSLVEAYGQTETGGAFISGQSERFARPGNVGTVVQGWQVRLDDDGQILVKGPDQFEGYWNQPEATRQIVDSEQWLHTGDVGEWQDGNLRLIDRARDFLVTAGGKTISPSAIESTLRASPYIGEAIVFGHGRKYLTALIEIDFDSVADWARANNVSYTGFTSLVQNEAVQGLIKSEIDKANNEFARVEQIKVFRILPKELDPEQDGEPVTPTRKVKRNLMYDRFKELVEGMYDDSEDRLLAAGAGDALR